MLNSYFFACQCIYEDKDEASVSLGVVKVKQFEDELHKLFLSYAQKDLNPLVNNMKLCLKGEIIELVPPPKLKNLNVKSINAGVSAFLVANHKIIDKTKEICSNLWKFDRNHNSMINNSQNAKLLQQFKQEKLQPSAIDDVLSNFPKKDIDHNAVLYYKQSPNITIDKKDEKKITQLLLRNIHL